MTQRKNKGGRPKKYTSIKKMQEDIDEYFKSCFRPMTKYDSTKKKNCPVRDFEGKIVYEQYRPFTITGLADALDMTRETLLRYGEDNKFSDTITRAKRKCEIYAEERLFDKDGANGAKFNLKNNFGWKDKQENVNVNTNYEEYLKKVERK